MTEENFEDNLGWGRPLWNCAGKFNAALLLE